MTYSGDYVADPWPDSGGFSTHDAKVQEARQHFKRGSEQKMALWRGAFGGMMTGQGGSS